MEKKEKEKDLGKERWMEKEKMMENGMEKEEKKRSRRNLLLNKKIS